VVLSPLKALSNEISAHCCTSAAISSQLFSPFVQHLGTAVGDGGAGNSGGSSVGVVHQVH